MRTYVTRTFGVVVLAAATLGFAACGSGTTNLQTAPATAGPTSTPRPATPRPATPTPPGATATPIATTPPGGSTPTPVATATAVASPSAITVSPAPLNFNATGYDLTFAANDPGYTGALSAASSNCTGVATFSPPSTNGPNATFTVASVGPGACQINVADTLGNSTAETIIVTTTTGSINLRRR